MELCNECGCQKVVAEDRNVAGETVFRLLCPNCDDVDDSNLNTDIEWLNSIEGE